MDKTSWLQKSKEERVAYVHEQLSKLVEVTRLQKNCARSKIKPPPHADKRVIERRLIKILEWEKEEHD